MYHVSSGWLLHDIPSSLRNEAQKITLRGYNEDFMQLPGDFTWDTPLSVDDIASDICPVRKDLYNDKARKLTGKQKDGKMTWGRVAGRIIEPYCTGLLERFDDLYSDGTQVTYQVLTEKVKNYSDEFFSKRDISEKLSQLTDLAVKEDLSSPNLELILQYSARNELAYLGADWVLGEGFAQKSSKLSERIPIIVDKESLKFLPDSKVSGLNQPATPDFIVKGLPIVGDIKSGKEFKSSHQHTCAGYALARESEIGGPGGDINFGIVYFVQTRSLVPVPARAYFFVINDAMRREFIDRRNKAYAVLSESQPPDISTIKREEYCIHCKFLDICDRDREG